MIETKRIFTAFFQSLVFHIGLIGLIILSIEILNLDFFLNSLTKQRKDLLNRSIKLDQIDRKSFEKIRRRSVGIKGGKGRRGSVGVQSTNKKSATVVKKGIQKGEGGLNFSKLRAKINEKSFDKARKKEDIPSIDQAEKFIQQQHAKTLFKKEVQAAEAGIPLTALQSKQAVQSFRRQDGISRTMLKDLSAGSPKADVLKAAGLNLHFEPPEGISEDELNSVEKIFYGFQKRNFVTYWNAFVSSYQRQVLNTPQVRKAFKNEKHLLTGKIDFDREGNVIRLKILRSSNNDHVHELFEKTLREIRTLPNPPKAFIEKRDKFTIYYQLKIN